MIIDEALLEQRLKDFKPEPLVPPCEPSDIPIELPVIKEDANNIDLAKVDYLNNLRDPDIVKKCEEVIREYGVGTCGPRAFFGTTDVHLNLEERIAQLLQVEESIVYSYGFVAISSSIAAYCKKSDIVFVDEKANFPIGQGLVAARSRVIKFSHNDPESFKQKVDEVTRKESNDKKGRRARKFLIIEAISWSTGKLAPILDFLTTCEANKIRVFVDESHSLGVLGSNGGGITNYFSIDPTRIDMTFGTLEGAIGSIGGFCAGSNLVIEHQRLSGSGYIFSASLPTYLVQAVIEAIDSMGNKPTLIKRVGTSFHDFLVDECGFEVMSYVKSPFKVFTTGGNEEEVHRFCKEEGVHFIFDREEGKLVMNLNVGLWGSGERMKWVFDVLKRASRLGR